MIDNHDMLLGQQIGNYRLTDIVAHGNYGSVYLGEHWLFKDEQAVALKLLHTHLDSQEKQQQFEREASLLRKLAHPHILPLIDAGTHRGIPYLVTIYASGGSLRDVLQEQQGRPFPVDIALHILLQVGEALEHAHSQHVIHRDLKPENILFGPQGEVFLADFGLAVALESTVTSVGDSQGTPLYMAPEQFEGLISPKSDQYALACIGYELLAGRRPFLPLSSGWETIWFHHAKVAPPAPTQFNAEIPTHVEQALLRGLAKERTERHSSITDFLAALNPDHDALTDIASIVASPTNPLQQHQAIHTPTSLETPDAPTQQLDTLEPAAKDALATEDLPARLERTQTAEAYRKQGHAFRNAGLHDHALQAYAQAIQLDPENPLAYYGQAKIFWEQQQYTEALQAYDHILLINSQDPFFHALKGDALYELHNYQDALTAYDQALALKQDNAFWHARRATILYALHMYTEALHAYDLALALKPEEAYYYTCKGDILSELKHEEEALQMYAKAVELDPRESWFKKHKNYMRRKI